MSFAIESDPRLLSPIITLTHESPDEFRLEWNTGERSENTHRVLLFIPGVVTSATVSEFHWSYRDERLAFSGNQDNFSLEKETLSAPRVDIRELGVWAGNRIAALTLTFNSYNSKAGPRIHFPQGEIVIHFQEAQLPGGRSSQSLPKAFQSIADMLFLNRPYYSVDASSLPCSSVSPHIDNPLLKIHTLNESIITISAHDVLEQVTDELSVSSLSLFQGKQSIPFQVLNREMQWKREGVLQADDLIRFFAPASRSPYSPETITWICQTPQEHQRVAEWNETAEESTDSCFYQRFHHEEDEYFIEGHGKNEEQADYWVGKELISSGSQTTAFSLPAALLNKDATLQIHLAAVPEYIHLSTDVIQVQVNHQMISGELTTVKEGKYQFQACVAAGILHTGTNEITISSCIDTHSKEKQIYLDFVDIHYPVSVSPANHPYYNLSGASSLLVHETAKALWWITENENHTYEILLSDDIVNSIKCPDPALNWKFFVLSASSEISSVTIEPVIVDRQRTFLLQRRTPAEAVFRENQQTDVVLITPHDWISTLRPYTALLQDKGYTTRAIAVEDIYDQLGDGRLSPHAIRDFLCLAYRQWLPPTPSYVILIGDATWDYWGRYRNGVTNIIPGYREHQGYAVENWFARLDSIDDRMPDMIVARFPVRSPEELETLIQKTVSYHRNPPTGDWYNRVFMLTDDGFENYSEELMEQWIPDGFRLTSRHISDYPLVDNIYLPEHLRIATRAKTSLEATKDIIDILNQGVFLWEYFGHGAPNVLGEERMFFGGGSKYSEVRKLTNQLMLPIFWAFTCETATFDYPRDKWNISIGEDMLTHPEGGVIHLLGATGRGYPYDHIILARALHESAFHYNLKTQGEIFFAATLLGLTQTSYFEPRDQFALLGCPLIEFPRFQTIEGTVQLKDHQLTYHWNSENLEPGRNANLWLQDEKDIRLTQPVAVPFDKKVIPGTLQLPSDLTSSTLRLGLDQVYSQAGTAVISQGAIGIPLEEHSTPLILPATGYLPDLTFMDDSLTFTPSSPRSGETIFFEARVANLGVASATGVRISGFYGEKEKPMEVTVGNSGVRLERLDPGEVKPVRLRWDPWNNKGKQRIILRVTSESFAETTMENNRISMDISVRQKADLVLDATHVRMELLPTGQYQLTFELLNQGESEADTIVVEISAALQNSDQVHTVRLPELIHLLPGKSYHAGGIKLPANLAWMEIVADPDGVVDEESHQNNHYRFEASPSP
ncbi:MAG: C25 family cysteine peptidase [bacterium]